VKKTPSPAKKNSPALIRAKPRVYMQNCLWAEGDGQSLGIGRLLDLSESGARIAIAAPRTRPQLVTIHWSLVPGTPEYSFEAVCMWVDKKQMGLKFRHLPPKQKHLLRSLVRYHRQEPKT
jgi:hypothetical protein